MELLVFLLVAAGAVGVLLVGYYLKRKRRDELALMARQIGLEYSPHDGQGCLGLPFVLLQKGDGRGAENVLWGTWSRMPVREFDYWYYVETTDSEGKRSKTYYRFSCAVTEIEAACSPITLDRENVLTKIADRIGLPDIRFELDEFNGEFNVKSKDARFANAFVDQRMMRFLLSTGREFEFEACARWLLCFGKRRRPTELVPLLGTLHSFREHVPRVVFDLYGLDASR